MSETGRCKNDLKKLIFPTSRDDDFLAQTGAEHRRKVFWASLAAHRYDKKYWQIGKDFYTLFRDKAVDVALFNEERYLQLVLETNQIDRSLPFKKCEFQYLLRCQYFMQLEW